MSPASEGLDITVVVIDDDESVRESLGGLFRSVGLRVQLFGSVNSFLSKDEADCPGCMVLDVRLPGQSGLEFLDDLARKGVHRPVIFISGHGDIPMSVRAMKAGATEFLTKPVRDQDLLDAVQSAIEADRIWRESTRRANDVHVVFQRLTRREREVMALVVQGGRNKEIAAKVGVSEATVKLHRGHVMRKMRARSVADLVRMADALTELHAPL